MEKEKEEAVIRNGNKIFTQVKSAFGDIWARISLATLDAGRVVGLMRIGNWAVQNMMGLVAKMFPKLARENVDHKFIKPAMETACSFVLLAVSAILEGQMTGRQKKMCSYLVESMALSAASGLLEVTNIESFMEKLVGGNAWSEADRAVAMMEDMGADTPPWDTAEL